MVGAEVEGLKFSVHSLLLRTSPPVQSLKNSKVEHYALSNCHFILSYWQKQKRGLTHDCGFLALYLNFYKAIAMMVVTSHHHSRSGSTLGC